MPRNDKSRELANNSSQSAPIYEWKKLYRRELLRAKFSETSDIYQITIDGEFWDISAQRSIRTIITDLYTEQHPYVAIGRAVIAYMEASTRSRIFSISIYKRYEKKSKK